MYVKNLVLQLLGAVSLASLTTALQLNYYSDSSCQNFIGSTNPGSCDPLPNVGIGSWLIVCDGNFDDSCENITFYNSNGGGCADEHAVTALSCSCNSQPQVPSQSGNCQSAQGLGVQFWGAQGF